MAQAPAPEDFDQGSAPDDLDQAKGDGVLLDGPVAVFQLGGPVLGMGPTAIIAERQARDTLGRFGRKCLHVDLPDADVNIDIQAATIHDWATAEGQEGALFTARCNGATLHAWGKGKRFIVRADNQPPHAITFETLLMHGAGAAATPVPRLPLARRSPLDLPGAGPDTIDDTTRPALFQRGLITGPALPRPAPVASPDAMQITIALTGPGPLRTQTAHRMVEALGTRFALTRVSILDDGAAVSIEAVPRPHAEAA